MPSKLKLEEDVIRRKKLLRAIFNTKHNYLNYVKLGRELKLANRITSNDKLTRALISQARATLNYKQKFFVGYDKLHEFQ